VTLAEIESRIAELKARKADLQTKTLRFADESWDGDVMAAESAVDEELKRLSALRTKALSGVDDESASSVQPTRQAAAPAWPMPTDFKSNPGDEIDPLLNHVDAVPTGAAFDEMTGKLFNFNLAGIVHHMDVVRKSLKSGNRPVVYSQGQHSAILATLAFVQTEARILAAYGRDRRSEVERKLLARIEALEARPDLKYLGVWASEKVYGTGNFVTEGGSLWHAQRASVGEKPGTGDAWQLAVKKGKDAR
jgi:hypothetical protein